jgi:hypothetical protein
MGEKPTEIHNNVVDEMYVHFKMRRMDYGNEYLDWIGSGPVSCQFPNSDFDHCFFPHEIPT